MTVTTESTMRNETAQADDVSARCNIENRILFQQTKSSYTRVKRVVDVSASILALPILVLVAVVLLILNPVANPGPLIFSQRRIGRHGKPFMMYKFRSMVGNAQETVFATQESARITKLGAFLRKQRLDELPQFINVFKGDMSLIGPRPEQEAMVKMFTNEIPNYQLRHQILPGITGLAQVCVGYADDKESSKRKLDYDLKYLRERNIPLDMKIIFRTICVVVSGFGAR